MFFLKKNVSGGPLSTKCMGRRYTSSTSTNLEHKCKSSYSHHLLWGTFSAELDSELPTNMYGCSIMKESAHKSVF